MEPKLIPWGIASMAASWDPGMEQHQEQVQVLMVPQVPESVAGE